MNADQLALLRLNMTPGLGRATLLKLLESYPTPAAILEHSRTHWQRQATVSSARIEKIPAEDDPLVVRARNYIEQNEVRLLTMADSYYPPGLRQISDPPALLYVRGEWSRVELASLACIAIVGSRRATRDGKRMAKELGRDLVRAGFCVVSGLAGGIDGAAHEGALSALEVRRADMVSTIGVLGGGIDVIYPRSNAHLYQEIAATGILISEYPPGCEPMAHHFPGRNRIISALSLGVIVVEAAVRSGSLITAEFALEHGHDVFAVPGSAYSPASSGTLQLLKDGAILVTCAQDVLDEYQRHTGHLPDIAPRSGVGRVQQSQSLFALEQNAAPSKRTPSAPPRQPDSPLESLDPGAQKVFSLLGSDPVHLDEIAGESGLTPMDVSSIVLHLELQGLIIALPGGRYIRV